MKTQSVVDWPSLNGADDFPCPDVVIVYSDLRAGQNAMRILANIVPFPDTEPSPHLQLWRFDLLEDPDWFALALADAINADIIVIATSSDDTLPALINNWMNLCLKRKRGTETAVVALLGEIANESLSPHFQFLQSVVREAGLDFFAPLRPGEESLPTEAYASCEETDWTSKAKTPISGCSPAPRTVNLRTTARKCNHH